MSIRSSTPGRTGSRYMRAEEMPSSKSALRARSNAESLAERSRTARADAIPKLSLYSRPSGERNVSPGDSNVPENHDPIITFEAPAASASATSLGCLTPPSAHTDASSRLASAAHSSTAENCGRPTPVIIRVVHIAPGPTPTLTMSAPADTRSATPAAVTTLPATTGTAGSRARTACSAQIIFSWCPCAVSTTSTSAPASSSSLARVATSPLTPSATPTRSRPAESTAGEYRVARSAPVRVMMPTQRPSGSSTGASRCRPSCSSANARSGGVPAASVKGWAGIAPRRSRCRPSCSSENARSGGVPAASVNGSADITWLSWVNRSTPRQSASVATPTGRPSSTTTTRPCARLGSRLSASPAVSVGASVSAVSTTRSRDFTQAITSATTSTGMFCGTIAIPPRRATVSAIRRPDTAVMLAVTMGMVAPLPSVVARSTSSREPTADRPGNMKTSLYVRSCSGIIPFRNRTLEILPERRRCYSLDPVTDPRRAANHRTLRLGSREWNHGSFGIMAVINRTPDSFFDRGATAEFGAALDAASRAVADGADIVDIGGVKAGPGDEVSAVAEIDRVVGLVAAVRERHPDVVISVDTWRAEVGEEVAQAGADLLNDAWGGVDPRLAMVAARYRTGLVCAHAGGLPPRTRPHRPGDGAVVREVTA